MTSDDILTVAEVAALLKTTEARVMALVRKKRLVKLPHVRPTRIPRWSLEAFVYHPVDEPDRQTPAQAAAPWGRHRSPSQGPLAGEAVGRSSALPRRAGDAADHVVVRRVEG